MILDTIMASKRKEVERLKSDPDYLAGLRRKKRPGGDRTRPLIPRLRKGPGLRVIAEIKRASPSAGIIRQDFEPEDIALAYEQGGASAFSILTERDHFLGDPQYLERVRKVSNLPMLRKDFVFDPWQIEESYWLGADAILLILSVLDDREFFQLMIEADRWNLTSLVEIHTAEERDRAVRAGAKLIGINNRDLHTFETRLEISESLAPTLPPEVTIVAESGIRGPKEMQRLADAGAHAVLVGESLMRSGDPEAKLKELLG